MQQDLVIQTLKSEVQNLKERWGQKNLKAIRLKVEKVRQKQSEMLQHKMKRQADGDQVLAMQIQKISKMKSQLEEYKLKREKALQDNVLLTQKLDKYSKMDAVIHGTMSSAREGTGNVEVMNTIMHKEIESLNHLISQQKDVKE